MNGSQDQRTTTLPPPQLSEIKKFVEWPPFHLSQRFIDTFFSATFSQEAIDHLQDIYHGLGREAEIYQPRHTTMSGTEMKRMIRFAFWDFCRRRAPWGVHTAHLAALAGLTWRHNPVTYQGMFYYRLLYQRDNGTPDELAATMAAHRQSKFVMKDYELEELRLLPDHLTLYRGGWGVDESTLVRGCSWSIEKRIVDTIRKPGASDIIFDKSDSLWRREYPIENDKIVVVQKRCQKSEVIALILDHGEAEIILCSDLNAASAINIRLSDEHYKECLSRRHRHRKAVDQHFNMDADIAAIKQMVVSAFPLPL